MTTTRTEKPVPVPLSYHASKIVALDTVRTTNRIVYLSCFPLVQHLTSLGHSRQCALATKQTEWPLRMRHEGNVVRPGLNHGCLRPPTLQSVENEMHRSEHYAGVT